METNEHDSHKKYVPQKTDNNQVIVTTNKPLLYYPDLNDSDIHNCNVVDIDEKQVLLASLNYQKIRALTIDFGDANFSALSEIIIKAIWDMGITEKSMTEEEQEVFVPIAIEEIKNEFPMLTIEDVRLAFKKGARRKYGIFYQMSIATIHCWLTSYSNETKPNAMLRLPFIKKTEEKTELTEEEKIKFHSEWLNKIFYYFDKFKETKIYDFYDFNNNFYMYCKKLGLINLDESQQQVIWNKAVDELKSEYHPKNAKSFGKRVDLKYIYDKLKLDELDKKQKDLIIIRARKITIFYFFKRLIKENKSLKEVVTDAEIKMREPQSNS